MIKLKNIFDLPITGDDVAEYYYLDCSEPEEDEAIAHAINCHDELVSALMEAQSILAHCKADTGYSSAQKRAAIQINDTLKKARGEK